MELPPVLRRLVDDALAHRPLRALEHAARTLSARYRGEILDGMPHIPDDLAARAYLATRLPATYAAIAAAFSAVAHLRPDFSPRSMLDIGAGPGTAMWAASRIWPVDAALAIERSGAIGDFGEIFSASLPVADVVWRAADIADGLHGESRDLVVIAYVLNELVDQGRDRLIAESWAATSDMLVLVEPGTPAGWRRMMRARDYLIAAGADLVAPCPHAAPCPLQEPDWCHFAQRLPRSRLHRQAKIADAPWEDEKFIYLACSRRRGSSPHARVIAAPKKAHGQVALKLCRCDGAACMRRWTRRDGAAFKAARRAEWGDPLAEDATQPGRHESGQS